MGRGSKPGRGKILFMFESVGCVLAPTHPHMDWIQVALFPWVKRPWLEKDRVSLPSAEIKNEWSNIPTHPYAIMSCKDNFTVIRVRENVVVDFNFLFLSLFYSPIRCSRN